MDRDCAVEAEAPARMARAVVAELRNTCVALRAMPDVPGARVHLLFARLYLETTRSWLDALTPPAATAATAGATAYVHLLIPRFHDLYRAGVLDVLGAGAPAIPAPWRPYHALAGRITTHSPAPAQIALVAMGARAHVRHDLARACALAEADHLARLGHPPGPHAIAAFLARHGSDEAFTRAARRFLAHHRGTLRREGRSGAILWSTALHAMEPVWLAHLQGWRHVAHREASTTRARGLSQPPPRPCAG